MQHAMHKTILVFATILIAGTTIARPLGQHPVAAGRVDARIQAMTEQLGLSETQQNEIRSIIEAHHRESDLRRQQLRQRIDAVLTDSQREAWTQLRSERMQKRLGRMSRRLGLSEAQRSAIGAILEEGRTRPGVDRADIRERIAAVLTPEQKALLPPRHGHRGSCRRPQWRQPPAPGWEEGRPSTP